MKLSPEPLTVKYILSLRSGALTVPLLTVQMPVFLSQGANALVTYTIISGADDSFRIDPESGDLIATRRLDRERRSKYSLLVRADDGLQSSDMRINITVSDVNDHSPKFSRPVYSFDIPEDTTPGRGVPAFRCILQGSHLTPVMDCVLTALH